MILLITVKGTQSNINSISLTERHSKKQSDVRLFDLSVIIKKIIIKFPTKLTPETVEYNVRSVSVMNGGSEYSMSGNACTELLQ